MSPTSLQQGIFKTRVYLERPWSSRPADLKPPCRPLLLQVPRPLTECRTFHRPLGSGRSSSSPGGRLDPISSLHVASGSSFPGSPWSSSRFWEALSGLSGAALLGAWGGSLGPGHLALANECLQPLAGLGRPVEQGSHGHRALGQQYPH